MVNGKWRLSVVKLSVTIRLGQRPNDYLRFTIHHLPKRKHRAEGVCDKKRLRVSVFFVR
jgi:hypothetical protein